VQFRLLGPLQIVVDGAMRSLSSPGEKAVLALLLLAAGRVLTRDALVDALWGADLPNNAVNALQGRISRLRKVRLRQALISRMRNSAILLCPSMTASTT